MNTIAKDIYTALIATLLFAVVLCGLYPVAIWGASQLLFPHQANGSLIESKTRTIVGSEWLGQNFAAPKYFHPRPSAAGANGYDASSSGGSNLGPTSQKLIDAVKARIAAYRAENGLPADAMVPGDAVTASGSGLDPHISVKNALIQADRVATTRKISVADVKVAIAHTTDGPSLGILGEPGVNVLKLNLALDNQAVPYSR